MSAIIGPHITGGVESHTTVLADWQPRLSLILDPECKDLVALKTVSPGTITVGRIYIEDSKLEALIRANPVQAAEEVHRRILASTAFGLVDYWQVENEILQHWDGLPLLNEFMVRRMELADQAGYRCGIAATSVGNLDMPKHDRLALYRRIFPAMAMAERGGHCFVVHQYGWPDLWGPAKKGGADWLIHRLEHQLLPRIIPFFPDLEFAVTELGVDQLLVSGQAGGWQVAPGMTALQYATDLYNIGQYLERYSDSILGYAVYALGHVDSRWSTYDIQGGVANYLAKFYQAEREAQSPPEPEPGNGHTVHLPIVTKPEKPAQEATMRVVDKNGMERDWAYLTNKYGAIEHLGRERFRVRFALIEVRETEGPAVAMATVLDTDGKPLPGYQVAFAWPDAPVDLGPHNYVSKWKARAAVQSTNENGDTGFGLGDGSYIRDLTEGGPHAMWVLSDRIPSEGLGNFGMLGGTNHMGPLRLTFQLADTTVEPVHTPNPEPIPQPDHTNASLEKTIARLLDVDLPILRAVLQVESGGRGHNGDGRLMIRFEAHIFRRYISSVDFAEHFRVDGPAAWEGHRFNDGSNWQNVHRNQNNEWAALGIAAVLNREAALKATAMGAAQIMGFNHEKIGYVTVGEMFDAFSASITPQLLGFAFFLLNTDGCLPALKARNFLTFAQLYNGLGNAPTYARLIREAIARLERP